MSEKVLSVIIPCYNEEKNIEKIVRRVLASPIKNKEIIINKKSLRSILR